MLRFSNPQESARKVIRVCVVDDKAIVRQSLAGLLEHYARLEVVGRCPVIDGAREVLSYNRVDILLVHFDSQRQHVFSLLKQLQQEGFGGRVVVIASSLSDSELIRLLCFGVSAILSSHDSAELLLKCIDRVMEGDYWLDQPLLRAVIRVSIDALRKAYGEPFTDREKTLMRGLMLGLTNKEIAERVDLEESGVKAAFHRIYKKTGVRSRGQLVRIALSQFGEEFHSDT